MSEATTERRSLLVTEFTHHLPYTIVGSLIAMAGVWWFGTQYLGQGSESELLVRARASFHLFHPLHLSLSAIATTSLSWRYRRHVLKTLLVGSLGTIIPCGLSDYVFPYVGGLLSGQAMEFHMCIVDHPGLFFSFLILGMLAGFWAEERLTGSHLFSHGAHVFISSVASLLYMISFGFTAWLTDVRFVFPALLTIVLAVWVPCCISDIVVPTSAAHPPAFPPRRRASDV